MRQYNHKLMSKKYETLRAVSRNRQKEVARLRAALAKSQKNEMSIRLAAIDGIVYKQVTKEELRYELKNHMDIVSQYMDFVTLLRETESAAYERLVERFNKLKRDEANNVGVSETDVAD